MRKLNFGCGTDIKECYDNVDGQKGKNITKSFDFNKFPYPFEDNEYDYIYMRNVLESLEDIQRVLDELWRISKPDAIVEIRAPYYANKGAYNCFMHNHYFSERAFIYYVRGHKGMSKGDQYEIIKLDLIPTPIGRFVPKYIREKINYFLVESIEVGLMVIKKKTKKK